MKIAICDDMKDICSYLETIIFEYRELRNIIVDVEVYNEGESLVADLKKGYSFDLIFLDIELNTTDGIKIGEIIRNDFDDYLTKIIYISSKSKYDRQLFDVQPLHFLSKPLVKEKVIKDLDLAIKLIGKNNAMFSLKKGTEIINLPVKEILYFESLNKQVKVICKTETIVFYEKMNLIQKELAKSRFLQPHRSYLVNYNHILSIKIDQITMSNNDVIPVSRNRYKEINLAHIEYNKEKFI